MNPGKTFEVDWKKSMVKYGLWNLRLRDNAMSYTQSESIFTHKNPYDFLCFQSPNLFCWELKHTKRPYISIQTTEEDSEDAMIKYHQIQGLATASMFDNVKAGFILSFFNENNHTESTFYLDINDFLTFLDESKKKSINIIDVVLYHGVRVSQHLNRTHYTYDIQELIDNIVDTTNKTKE